MLNAQGQLDGLTDQIEAGIKRARLRAETVTDPVSIDVVVQVWPKRVIEERGHVGHTPTATMMYLTFDPEKPNLARNLGEPLERMVAHELHHVLRNAGPGYGTSLGEALVSEGLTGQFVQQLFQSGPEPWERAITREELAPHLERVERDWDRQNYGHDDWFFGAGEQPFWFGYTLGYRLVEAY
ncbi:MAG: DUF2268 domain-containing putative Zn-dependent protease [Pseudomonadota bacterium]